VQHLGEHHIPDLSFLYHHQINRIGCIEDDISQESVPLSCKSIPEKHEIPCQLRAYQIHPARVFRCEELPGDESQALPFAISAGYLGGK
jgi:hypothetical protein